MAYVELQTYPISEGPQILLCYVNDVLSGSFMPMLFLGLWIVITLSSYFIQKRSSGFGDIPVSMTYGSFITFIASVMLKLVTCPYNPLTSDLALGVLIGIFMVSVIFLFMSRD